MEQHLEDLVLKNKGLIFTQLFKIKGYKSYMSKEDMVQIGYVALIKAAHSFDRSKGTKFSTYASHVILMEYYSLFRKLEISSISIEDPLLERENIRVIDLIPDKTNYYSKIEDKVLLIQMIKKLPDSQKKCICMYYFKRMNQLDISKAIGISQAMVSRNIKNGIKQLKKELES